MPLFSDWMVSSVNAREDFNRFNVSAPTPPSKARAVLHNWKAKVVGMY